MAKFLKLPFNWVRCWPWCLNTAAALPMLLPIGREPETNRFVLNLAIAFIPAAVVGLLFSKQIKAFLFNPISVATALWWAAC